MAHGKSYVVVRISYIEMQRRSFGVRRKRRLAITYYLLPITYYLLPVTFHLSPLTSLFPPFSSMSRPRGYDQTI